MSSASNYKFQYNSLRKLYTWHILKSGLDDGRLDDGRWTMDDGQIKHTLTRHAVCFLFLQLRHAINHFVAYSSRNLDSPRSLFIYLQDMYQIQEIQPFERYHLGFAKQR